MLPLAYVVCVFFYALAQFVCACFVCQCLCVDGLQVCTEPKAVGSCLVRGSFEATQSSGFLSTWLMLTVDGKTLVRLCNASSRHQELRAYLCWFRKNLHRQVG